MSRLALITIPVVLIVGACASGPAAPSIEGGSQLFRSEILEPEVRVYQVQYQGNDVSEYTYSLSRNVQSSVPVLVLERSFSVPEGDMEQLAVVRADTLEPIRSQSRGPLVLDLSQKDRRIRGQIDTQDKPARKVDIAAPEGTLLPYVYETALASMPLHVGFTRTTNVIDPDTAAVGIVGARVLGERSITVPAGTFQVYEVELTGFEPSTLFVRKEAPHVIIRQDLASSPVSLVLKQVSSSD